MENQSGYERLLESRLSKIEADHNALDERQRGDLGLIFKKLETVTARQNAQGQRQSRLLAMSNLISVLIGGAAVEFFKWIQHR